MENILCYAPTDTEYTNNLRLLPSSQKGQTPLLLATRKNDRATVQELLAVDVDVDYIEEVSVHALILVSVIWCLI